MNSFYYVGFEKLHFDDSNMLKIFVLDYKTKNVHKIYKASSNDYISKLENTKVFTDITNLINFVIKPNGSISLDIKL